MSIGTTIAETPRVLGVDPSTSTGLAVLGHDCQHVARVVFESERGMDRVQSIAQAVGSFIDQYEPGVAFIEGYGYANTNTLVPLVEIGTAIRLELHRRGIKWFAVAPTVLKKWTTGKGNAKKADMLAAVVERWGFTSVNDDVVDAYSLARYGHYHLANLQGVK